MAGGAYNSEDIHVTFSADTTRADYGVPGSPVFEEIEGFQVINLEILGVNVDMKSLPLGLQKAIQELGNYVTFE